MSMESKVLKDKTMPELLSISNKANLVGAVKLTVYTSVTAEN